MLLVIQPEDAALKSGFAINTHPFPNSEKDVNLHTVAGSEIPNNQDVKNLVNNGIFLPYQLMSRISEPSTVPNSPR